MPKNDMTGDFGGRVVVTSETDVTDFEILAAPGAGLAIRVLNFSMGGDTTGLYALKAGSGGSIEWNALLFGGIMGGFPNGCDITLPANTALVADGPGGATWDGNFDVQIVDRGAA